MTDSRKAIKSGSRFEKLAGYSRAIVDRDWVFISGTAGHNADTGEISDDASEQARQSLRTIKATLEKADASIDDIVRVRVFVRDRDDVIRVSQVLGMTFKEPQPANTTVLCGFAEESMKVEIEVTALKKRQ